MNQRDLFLEASGDEADAMEAEIRREQEEREQQEREEHLYQMEQERIRMEEEQENIQIEEEEQRMQREDEARERGGENREAESQGINQDVYIPPPRIVELPQVFKPATFPRHAHETWDSLIGPLETVHRNNAPTTLAFIGDGVVNVAEEFLAMLKGCEQDFDKPLECDWVKGLPDGVTLMLTTLFQYSWRFDV